MTMKRQRISSYRLAMKNIRKKAGRSFILILFLMIFSFALLVGTMISIGLAKGVESLSNRLGADVMAVPAGYNARIDSVLLSGEPNNFFLPANAMEKLTQIEGIEKMSPQVYLATLKSYCCSVPVQIIGIDFETDFIIKPWLTGDMADKLRDGEVIIGHRVNGIVGEELSFFNQPYQVAGQLAQTGMSFDATVFMNRNTVLKLAKEAERIMEHPLSQDNSLVSTVMIKLKAGYDSEKVASEITNQFAGEGIFGVFSKKFVNQVSSNLQVVKNYVNGILPIFWIMALLVIGLIFMLSFQERKKELAVLRALGGTRKKLLGMVLLEALVIGGYASGLGVLLGVVFVLLAAPTISTNLTIPFLLPDLKVALGLVLFCFAFGCLTSTLASLFSALRIVRGEIYQNLRENE